jgi:hypothetical protein
VVGGAAVGPGVGVVARRAGPVACAQLTVMMQQCTAHLLLLTDRGRAADR